MTLRALLTQLGYENLAVTLPPALLLLTLDQIAEILRYIQDDAV